MPCAALRKVGWHWYIGISGCLPNSDNSHHPSCAMTRHSIWRIGELSGFISSVILMPVRPNYWILTAMTIRIVNYALTLTWTYTVYWWKGRNRGRFPTFTDTSTDEDGHNSSRYVCWGELIYCNILIQRLHISTFTLFSDIQHCLAYAALRIFRCGKRASSLLFQMVMPELEEGPTVRWGGRKRFKRKHMLSANHCA